MSSIYRPPTGVHPTPAEVAQWTGGRLLEGEKAPDRLSGLATLSTALSTEIAFISDPNRARDVSECGAGLLLTPAGLDLPGRARLEVPSVWAAVALIMERLYGDAGGGGGIHETAVIGRDVSIGAGVEIAPYVVIGDECRIGDRVRIGAHCAIDPGCVIGEGSRLHANVSLQGHVELGRQVLLHSGVTLGAEGFRFERTTQGPLKIPQVGAVILEDEVEIGANTTIDRAFIHETRIGHGTKIDNLVQIGHNCMIGRFCLIAGCVGMAGSVTLGDGVIIGGGAGLRNNLKIGDGAMIAGGSQVAFDMKPGEQVMGYPAFAGRDFMKSQAIFRKLPEINRRLAALERREK